MMTVSQPIFSRERASAHVPLWREAFAGLDWLALHTSPVFYGLGVPRGDGSAVIVVPGFLGTDHYLYEMYAWLRRIGYKAYLSNIGWNADCLHALTGRLHETIEKAARETGGKVHLIGHSLGGVLSRSAATQFPDNVASVTTLGSPIRGIRSHPLVLATANQVRAKIISNPMRRAEQPDCYTGFCGCASVVSMQQALPAKVRMTAIYTKTDGVVDWQVCITGNAANDVEVTGTHVGLAFNPEAYRLIAQRLAS